MYYMKILWLRILSTRIQNLQIKKQKSTSYESNECRSANFYQITEDIQPKGTDIDNFD